MKKNQGKLLTKSKVTKQNSSEKDIDATDNITIEPTTSSNVELKDFLDSINLGKYFKAMNDICSEASNSIHYADGTFEVSSEIFYQLYTISIIHNAKFIYLSLNFIL